MNKPEISRDEDIYHELLTLNEAVLNEDVPLSVRLSGDILNISICENAGLQAGEQIQVLERRTLDVARVRVFGHESDDGSYSAGEAKPIGEFFIPAKFPGRLMLIRKPCSRKSFSCVAEVIDDMPKRLCVDEDIMTIPPQGFGRNTSFISKGTILETIRVFTCLRNLETYIQCRFGGKTYYLKKSLQLQCSAIDDDTMYTLTDLQKLKVHPIFFKFVASESRGVNDVQRYGDSSKMYCVKGPMELLTISQADVYICQYRTDNRQLLIVPVFLGDFLSIQIEGSDAGTAREEYLDTFLDHCQPNLFDDRLYLLDHTLLEVVHLNVPGDCHELCESNEDCLIANKEMPLIPVRVNVKRRGLRHIFHKQHGKDQEHISTKPIDHTKQPSATTRHIFHKQHGKDQEHILTKPIDHTKQLSATTRLVDPTLLEPDCTSSTADKSGIEVNDGYEIPSPKQKKPPPVHEMSNDSQNSACSPGNDCSLSTAEKGGIKVNNDGYDVPPSKQKKPHPVHEISNYSQKSECSPGNDCSLSSSDKGGIKNNDEYDVPPPKLKQPEKSYTKYCEENTSDSTEKQQITNCEPGVVYPKAHQRENNYIHPVHNDLLATRSSCGHVSVLSSNRDDMNTNNTLEMHGVNLSQQPKPSKNTSLSKNQHIFSAIAGEYVEMAVPTDVPVLPVKINRIYDVPRSTPIVASKAVPLLPQLREPKTKFSEEKIPRSIVDQQQIHIVPIAYEVMSLPADSSLLPFESDIKRDDNYDVPQSKPILPLKTRKACAETHYIPSSGQRTNTF